MDSVCCFTISFRSWSYRNPEDRAMVNKVVCGWLFCAFALWCLSHALDESIRLLVHVLRQQGYLELYRVPLLGLPYREFFLGPLFVTITAGLVVAVLCTAAMLAPLARCVFPVLFCVLDASYGCLTKKRHCRSPCSLLPSCRCCGRQAQFDPSPPLSDEDFVHIDSPVLPKNEPTKAHYWTEDGISPHDDEPIIFLDPDVQEVR